jgi:hypothetical protein
VDQRSGEDELGRVGPPAQAQEDGDGAGYDVHSFDTGMIA